MKLPMEPLVLLATTYRWFSTARLAMAFRDSGAIIDAVCPAGHPIGVTSAARRLYRYHGLAPLASLGHAIASSRPDIIIPCDDLTRAHLHRMYEGLTQPGSNDEALRILLERSLGDPAGYPIIDTRSGLIALANELAIKAPETAVVSSVEQVRQWIATLGTPLVLKTDGTSGGIGVKIASSEAEAVHAFELLNSPPRLLRTVKRAIVDQDRTLLLPWLQRRRPVINVQRFLPFADATIAVACWQGKVLASISVEVMRTWKTKGPASLVRLIDNSDMQQAALKLTKHLRLSGLCGFDFVLDEDTGEAHLIEMNPRATQTCHLALGRGSNLTAALTAAIAGQPVPDLPSITQSKVIALFPLEWQNDPSSPYLRSAYHDVPWEEPQLVQACVESRMRNGGLLTYDNLNRIRRRLFRNRA